MFAITRTRPFVGRKPVLLPSIYLLKTSIGTNFDWRVHSRAHYNTDASEKKEFIMSILNSTATKREAKDYLNKYASGDKFNVCIIVLQDLLAKSAIELAAGEAHGGSVTITPSSQSRVLISGFTSTVYKLQGLGIKPIIIIDEKQNKNRSYQATRILDDKFAKHDIKSCICPEVITKSISGKNGGPDYRLSYPLYEDILKEGVIPIIEPIVFDESDSTKKLSNNLPEYISNLIKLLEAKNKISTSIEGGETGEVSIEKIFILNETGGIPSKDRNNFSHVFINLCDEYNSVKSELHTEIQVLEKDTASDSEEALQLRINQALNKRTLVSKIDTYKQCIGNLEIMNAGLRELPLSATGVIASLESCCSFDGEENSAKKNPLLYNVLTDRSLISSSLPMFKKTQIEKNLNDKKWYELSFHDESGHTRGNDSSSREIDPEESAFFYTTVLKKGVDIKFFTAKSLNQYNATDLPTEFWTDSESRSSSCEMKLDMRKFTKIINSSFNRELDLSHYLRRINGNIATIIVIGDYEGIAILTYEPTSQTSSEKVDQFVYLDKFAVMPHLKGSLGISDIIFNEMFKKFGKELLWRSRKDNVVNKWYFQRSCGSVDLSIDLGDGDIKEDCIFRLFYYGDNKRFSDVKRLQKYAKYIRDIEPSWKK